MTQKLQLSIKQPCHENWQHMTIAEQGRHCKACAKTVVDFTTMNDTEVLNYFISNRQENTCGRFYADQLNRRIEKPVYEKRKMMWYWHYVVMLFLLFFKNNAGKAQAATPHPQEQVKRNNETKAQQDIQKEQNNPFEISGKITNNAGIPIADARIQIKGTERIFLGNSDGIYHLNAISKNDVLVVSSVGYIQKEMKVNYTGENNFVLEESVVREVMIMGKVAAGYYDKHPAATEHVAEIEVKGDRTNKPPKAKLRVNKLNGGRKR
ncbi:MAG: carboxypeptidase-like regulatory domain-containing protein [Ferruginibacter sp.]